MPPALWRRLLGRLAEADRLDPLVEWPAVVGTCEAPSLPTMSRRSLQHQRVLPAIVAAIKPQGHITFIDNIDQSILPFKPKSVTISWEMMFTRSLFQTDDMDAQHRLLSEVSALVDAGVLRSTLTQNLGRISVENLRKAHLAVESGRAIGKLVLEGF